MLLKTGQFSITQNLAQSQATRIIFRLLHERFLFFKASIKKQNLFLFSIFILKFSVLLCKCIRFYINFEIKVQNNHLHPLLQFFPKNLKRKSIKNIKDD